LLTLTATLAASGALAANPPSQKQSTSVKDFGAACNGSTDDAAPINAALAAMTANTYLSFPAGICVFKSALAASPPGGVIAGAGPGGTTLLYAGTSTTSDLLFLSNTTRLMISNLRIWSRTTMTAGAALHCQRCSITDIVNVDASLLNYATNTLWTGIWVDQPNFVRIDGFYLIAQHDCLAVSALGVGTAFQYDLFAMNGKVGSCNAGVHVGGGIDNVHFDKIEDTSNTYDVVIDNALESFKNQESFFGPDFVTDQAAQSDYEINDPLCNQTNYCIVSIDGPVTHADAGDGIWVKSLPNGQVHIDSPFITQNAGNGVHISDTSTVVAISGSTFTTNNGLYGIMSDFLTSNVLSVGQVTGNTSGQLNANISVTPLGGSTANPTIASGFGTGASVSQANGTHSFLINVGTGGVASSGVINIAPATNGWNCTAINGTTFSSTVFATRITGNTTTTVNLGNFNSSFASAPWASGDALQVNCQPR
jgi:hypothetical protein